MEGLHRLLLGDPTAKVVTSGLPRPYAAVAAGIAAQIPLPIDGPFMLIKMSLQVAGMAVGLLAGFPVLTTACCKSFLHDQLTGGAARGIEAVVRDLASPASPRERAVQGRERSPALGREGPAHGHRAASGADLSAGAGPDHVLPTSPARPTTRGWQRTPGRRGAGQVAETEEGAKTEEGASIPGPSGGREPAAGKPTARARMPTSLARQLQGSC